MQGKGIFVTGTDTNVGKTHVTAGLAACMQRQWTQQGGSVISRAHDNQEGNAPHSVAIWKPVQSGALLGDPDADSYRLWKGSGLAESEAELVSYCFREPLAPMVAAKLNGIDVSIEGLEAEGRKRLQSADFLWVEGAGGIAVPLNEQSLLIELAVRLELPILIIARAGLGTVNHTLLTIAYARQLGLSVAGVILNGVDERSRPLISDNIQMIEQFGQVSVLGAIPWHSYVCSDVNWEQWREEWCGILSENLDLTALRKYLYP